MIFDNNEITAITYSGYNIIRVYSCGGELVFGDEPPSPTGMTGLKVSGYTSQNAFSAECDSDTELTPHEIPANDYNIEQLEVGTCINVIGIETLANKPIVTDIILPSTITWFKQYRFLHDDTSIQSLTINATTPPRFQNYVEDEWQDIFGYTYPSSQAPTGFKIYVPEESLNAYKTAEGWSHMADYFVAITPPLKFYATYGQWQSYSAACNSSTELTSGETKNQLYQYDYINMDSAEIGDCVTSLGDGVFSSCNGLSSITIPDSVTTIGDYAFESCISLTSCTIGSGVTSIGEYAFEKCSGLTNVTIPNSVTSIGGYAFYQCSGLTSCTIGSGVTSIGGSAFRECGNISSVTIPDSVTYIGDRAFYRCSGLTSCTIGSGVTSIGGSAFNFCSGITSIDIPSGVTSIGSSAFSRCYGITSMDIPSGVTSIGQDTFRYCSGLTSCTIGSGVTSIGNNAFQYCSGLTSMDIPSGVTSIGSQAFQYCRGLTSMDIPSGVTSIGNRAFASCSGLTSVTINAIAPPTLGSNVFQYTNNFPIYVPTDSVETYKSAGGWSTYADRIQAIQ